VVQSSIFFLQFASPDEPDRSPDQRIAFFRLVKLSIANSLLLVIVFLIVSSVRRGYCSLSMLRSNQLLSK
jgi:hypothetical protein